MSAADTPSTLKSTNHLSSRSLTQFVIPDLISYHPFDLKVNKYHEIAAAESLKWISRGGSLNQKDRQSFHDLKAGLLAAICYPHATYQQLKVCCDYVNYLWHLDDLSDDMDDRGTKAIGDEVLNTLYHPDSYQPSSRIGRMTHDFWTQFTSTASRGAQQRLIETFGFFFQAVSQQAIDRANGDIPDIESYITLRRDTGACRPCMALIEYANNLDIPDEVMDHPIIRNLCDAMVDLVSWSNDIFSFNVEQSKGHTHNMVVVVMNEKGTDLQSAVDFVGDLCRKTIDGFLEDWRNIPSWGAKIDRDVALYVDGLANWIFGGMIWSFESERYFAKEGLQVRASRVVQLLPRVSA